MDGFSRSGVGEPADRLTGAISTSVSIAARAIPIATVAMLAKNTLVIGTA